MSDKTMSDKNEIDLAKLLELVSEQLGEEDVTLETSLDALESLDFMDLVLQCENEFDVKIPQQSILRMNTVEDVLTIIAEARSVSLPS